MDKPTAIAPPVQITPPSATLPVNACDAHVHLIGDDFALWDGRIENPPPGTIDTWLDRYRAHLAALGCSRGVIVHSILYGGDNSITLEATRRMGDQFRAVCLISDNATEAEIAALAGKGCKAVRLNYVHGGLLSWDGMKRLAPKLADHGLHVEMLAHSHLHLEELAPQVPHLPVQVVFDHCAWPDPKLGVTDGHKALERLLADGHAWTKLSATYRHTPEPQDLIRRLAKANPDRILWGSDWPHLMLNGVLMPDAGQQLNLVLDAIPDDTTRQKLFTDNPARLYGFAS
ncbi:amidohydrolase family protein [Marivita hallyeonensis]|uniref:Predicted metal-dependent hydrolase, TIM-barrel fold n=1 Tax=Marivita hallyeonensis TaxID=996342 RepID=A0A1M5VN73_9RHOB|nr:amidohydrolase family protein [Marivita hallyeonensis]SHH76701.1 Predicted metal-dependent hydrolase, TIM-barrel fold [Marivita hallyeonensis]